MHDHRKDVIIMTNLQHNTYKDKKEEKENAAFKDLWNYHLEPLLQEYLRGMEDADKKLESLKKAYNKEEVKPASPQS